MENRWQRIKPNSLILILTHTTILTTKLLKLELFLKVTNIIKVKTRKNITANINAE